MLVVERRRNEAVLLSGGIKILVGDIRGPRVKLVIDAPVSVAIYRAELADSPDPNVRRSVREALGIGA